MKIGILETGEVGADLKERHGNYPDMFVRLFRDLDPNLAFETFSVVSGTLPDSVHDADGWLVTGSRHGVYDELPWIPSLKAFLRACVSAQVPIVGVCFGHQILAEALGGRAVKSSAGWGIGVQTYTLLEHPKWLGGVPEHFSMRAMHQDQVVDLPADAHVLAASDHCPYAALAYGPVDAPYALTIQPHPEFTADYVDALIAGRTGDVFPPEMAAAARASLEQPADNTLWAQIMLDFFRKEQGPNGKKDQNGIGLPR